MITAKLELIHLVLKMPRVGNGGSQAGGWSLKQKATTVVREDYQNLSNFETMGWACLLHRYIIVASEILESKISKICEK